MYGAHFGYQESPCIALLTYIYGGHFSFSESPCIALVTYMYGGSIDCKEKQGLKHHHNLIHNRF